MFSAVRLNGITLFQTESVNHLDEYLYTAWLLSVITQTQTQTQCIHWNECFLFYPQSPLKLLDFITNANPLHNLIVINLNWTKWLVEVFQALRKFQLLHFSFRAYCIRIFLICIEQNQHLPKYNGFYNGDCCGEGSAFEQCLVPSFFVTILLNHNFFPIQTTQNVELHSVET